jgi:uncharacterized protein YbjT (DUF2867 family)
VVRVPPALMQPIAAEDVATLLTEVVVGRPVNGTVEIAGPEPIRQDELVRRFLAHGKDPRRVVTDPAAGYFGAPIDDRSLTPAGTPRTGRTGFGDWLDAAALRK